MKNEHVKNLLSELCYFDEVDITHTFSVDGIRILQVKCLNIDSQHIFELTYPDSDIVDFHSDIAEAEKAITSIISKGIPA
ncbi:hypothetical protein ABE28_019750 [Peribacillus muralis]|uniref:DUF1797 domain-containing protein n=1 Tax=Peribacillus muralis TaxID=264697 RepID=A0A1B3XTV1_9BACI|nr:hypothetical protein [Peribacillus muralis]AOH56608.1 hypothetical protein ABE28_019750 [Peribacillus muralis]